MTNLVVSLDLVLRPLRIPVVLRFPKRTIVVSPDDPAGFVAVLEERYVVPPLGGSAEWPPEGGTTYL